MVAVNLLPEGPLAGKNFLGNHTVPLNQQKSTFTTAREVLRDNPYGLCLGMGATLYRNGVWNMMYFGAFHNARASLSSKNSKSSANIEVFYRLLLGFAAGTLASIANIPFDVAKSRIQGPQPAGGRLYHNTWQAIVVVRRREGFAALYRGLLPKVMRLGPGGGIMLVVYESVYDFLKMYT